MTQMNFFVVRWGSVSADLFDTFKIAVVIHLRYQLAVKRSNRSWQRENCITSFSSANFTPWVHRSLGNSPVLFRRDWLNNGIWPRWNKILVCVRQTAAGNLRGTSNVFNATRLVGELMSLLPRSTQYPLTQRLSGHCV